MHMTWLVFGGILFMGHGLEDKGTVLGVLCSIYRGSVHSYLFFLFR